MKRTARSSSPSRRTSRTRTNLVAHLATSFMNRDQVSRLTCCGPTGEITYLGNSTFNIEGSTQCFDLASLVLGDSGITPGYSLIKRVVQDAQDSTHISVGDANKTEDDILLRDELTAPV